MKMDLLEDAPETEKQRQARFKRAEEANALPNRWHYVVLRQWPIYDFNIAPFCLAKDKEPNPDRN
jgi:hypothetical protein